MANSIESLDFSKIIYQTINNASLFYSTSPKLSYLLGFGFMFFVYYYTEVVKVPVLYSGNKRFKDFLIKHCGQIIEKPIYPTFYAFNTHAQTVLANFIRGTLPKLEYKRECLTMPDGGEVSLDWYKDDERPKDGAPICIFMPGLTGDSSTEYIISLVPNAYSVGVRCCVLINRGRGGMELKTPRLYCASNCEDCEHVLNHIKSKNPKSKIIAVGISLGGIVLGRYLSLKGDDAVVDAAMLISVCYDFFSGCTSLENNRINLALNHHLSRSLKTILSSHRKVLELNKKLDFDEILKSKTLKEFDRTFTIKMWGYEKVEDYYRDASLKDKLHLIKKPTLCVNARDDMFQPLETLPIEEFKNSNHLALILTSRGGHIGFMDNPYPPFFTDRLCKEYLAALKSLEDIKESIG